ncbi:MAG: hypothetical protein L0287_05825 [Anaerolineae bacterium]|nr:hypothetical protein [Anaerolineae bacterium]
MESWYAISLGDAITAATPSAEIEELFLQSFRPAGSPHDMAVFTRLHCEVIAYFSPAGLCSSLKVPDRMFKGNLGW